jgi:hypothetical protein
MLREGPGTDEQLEKDTGGRRKSRRKRAVFI